MPTDTCKILIPRSVLPMNNPETPNGWTFGLCVQWVVDRHPRFNQTGPGMRQGGRIVAAVITKGAGEESDPLPRADCTALLEALNEPAVGPMNPGYCPELSQRDPSDPTKVTPMPVPARIFIPYLDAVEVALSGEAPKELPAPKAEPVANGVGTQPSAPL